MKRDDGSGVARKRAHVLKVLGGRVENPAAYCAILKERENRRIRSPVAFVLDGGVCENCGLSDGSDLPNSPCVEMSPWEIRMR